MITLRSAGPSPYGRKVKIAAYQLGLMDRIEIVNADTNDPSEKLRQQNPLGKIPTLVLEDGMALYDSRVIVEYLDHMAGGCKLIPAGAERFPQLVLQALADGLMDALLLQVYEVRFRPEDRREQKWLDNQAGKVARAMAVLEANPPDLGQIHIGEIAVACALGYQDLRFGGTWRATHPKLVAWLDRFAALVPRSEKTRTCSSGRRGRCGRYSRPC
jgi:glutathione S-transferase